MKYKTTIFIFANKYPNSVEPNVNVFTQQITWSFADLGYKCVVINPIAVNYNKKYKGLSYRDFEYSESGSKIEIYRPRYIGLGQDGSVLQKLRVYFTTQMYIKATDKILKLLDYSDAVIFAEFLCPSGVAASALGGKYSIPAYMQCGEATYQGDKKYGNSVLKNRLLKNLNGVIALSGQNKNFLTDAGIFEKDKVIILPSGYRKDRIYKRNKIEARKKFNMPLDKFIVGFCGSFDDRKGIMRLTKAIDDIDDQDIVLAACGKGELDPISEKIIFKGPINHVDLGWFYSALDVFAFPTYHEGSCTAIVEAIACGCPIISSDRPFNYEICDDNNSILIDPNDIEAMKINIVKLKNDTSLREKLSAGSLEKAKELSLDAKAKKIIDYMNI